MKSIECFITCAVVFLVVLFSGCASTAYDVKIRDDSFQQRTIYQLGMYELDGGSVFTPGVSLGAAVYRKNDGGVTSALVLIITFNETSNPGQLTVLFDRTPVDLAGENYRVSETSSNYYESVVYPIQPDDLKRFLNTKTVKVRVYGHGILDRSLSPEVVSNFKRFVNEYLVNKID